MNLRSMELWLPIVAFRVGSQSPPLISLAVPESTKCENIPFGQLNKGGCFQQ